MKKQTADLYPLRARIAAPTTAIATALVAPFAHAASGDLDPAFADHGRQGPIAELEGAARSIEAPDDGGVILGGGYLDASCRSYYCWYDIYLEASNFIDALSEDGAIDSAYDAGVAAGIEVFDIARQDDGNVVAVGRRVGVRNAAYNKLAVFRLAADGPLDAGFGDGGVVELDSGRFGEHNQASAVLVEPNGRIVIAGARNEELIVLRLNADGSLDGSFGDSGAFAGPAHDYDSGSRIVRVSTGGYRVTTTSGGTCRILALTAKGSVDTSYGAAGYAEVAGDLGGAIACHSIAAQADDRLVIAGAAAGQPFAVRLLASGAPDPSFTAPDIALTLQEAAAIAVAADGKIVVAGEGLSGATIMRLQATGQLDAPFGQAGATHIDLPSEYGARPVIHDLVVRSDGSVLAAGGDYASSPVRPFAVRLLGDAGGESPGVLSVVEPFLETAEDGEAAIRVRRTGGGSGEVSIAYRTTLDGDLAVPGQDYEEKSGRLHWDDGDTGERTVIVPVLAGDDEPEEYESFKLRLSDAEGGVGIGTQNAVVTILPDGAPAGQFALQVYDAVVYESGVLGLSISRNYYDQGEACVTLTTRAGSAVGGDDFAGDPATICWDNGQSGETYAEIQIVDDKRREGDETFEVVLSNPTGGAILGPRATATVIIAANDDPVSVSPPSDGGGGAAGFLSLLALGLLEILRAARRVLRIRTGDMP